MRLVRDTDIDAAPACLVRAWEGVETFVLLPHRGVNPEWLDAATRAVPPHLRSGHVALTTSGSTGAPKLIIGRRDRAEALARVLHSVQQSEDVGEAITALPLTYSYAFVNQWVWSRVHGRRLTRTRGLADPAGLSNALRRADTAMDCLVGAQVPLLRLHFPEASFPGVIRLHFAGGPFPQAELPFLRKLFPRADIFNNYGCAEAMPRLTIRSADAAGTSSNIGAPLPGVSVRAAENGQLEFRSPFRAVAAVDAQKVRAIDDAAWLATGDLGRPLEDGSWELLGRDGDIFKRFGEKVVSSAVVAVLRDAWTGSIASFREVEAMGEPGYVVVLAPHPTPNELRELLLELRRTYSRPHWPLRLESVATLPVLPNGKPDLGSLPTTIDRQVQWTQRY